MRTQVNAARQSIPVAPISERRLATRSSVHWTVHARAAEAHFIGAEVFDVSVGGLFIHPVERRGNVSPGDAVELHVFPLGLDPGIRAQGIVQWVGYSHTHGAHGFGVKLTEPLSEEVSF